MSSVLLASLILAHNILAMMFFGFFMLYAVLLTHIEIKKLLVMVFVGLGLALLFIVMSMPILSMGIEVNQGLASTLGGAR